MTTTSSSQNDQFNLEGTAGVADYFGEGYVYEGAVLNQLAGESGASVYSGTISPELPSPQNLETLINTARVRFVREMAHSLLISAIESHDAGDWDSLAQVVVDWGSTLELEGDINLRRRMQRRRKAM